MSTQARIHRVIGSHILEIVLRVWNPRRNRQRRRRSHLIRKWRCPKWWRAIRAGECPVAVILFLIVYAHFLRRERSELKWGCIQVYKSCARCLSRRLVASWRAQLLWMGYGWMGYGWMIHGRWQKQLGEMGYLLVWQRCWQLSRRRK